MEEVLQFLKENPTFFIATSIFNKPKVRPFGAVTLYNNRLYLVTNNQKEVYKQILGNPYIEICGYDNTDTWLRIEAKVITDQDDPIKEQILNEYPALQKLYSIDDGIMEVMYLKDACATFYSFTNPPKTITF